MVSVLLSESASLTARETLTVLGGGGVAIDVVDSGRWTIGRFSRWCRRAVSVPPPGTDPVGYLRRIGELVVERRYDAVLPTHEQAWLLAAGRHLLPADTPIAVAPIEAFDRVQGKIEFAELLDELAIPQPRWWRSGQEPEDVPYPHWVKASHGTAGRSVRRVHNHAEQQAAIAEFTATGETVMGQEPATGQYGQVQALFEHGRMVAVHTSVQIGAGAGGSAAARLSVDHPEARQHTQTIGEYLDWHGGLTLDYLHVDGRPQFIECNPRTVEPGNAAAAGIDLPSLTIALSRRDTLSPDIRIGRAGIRTRSALALIIGAAERGTRRTVAATLINILTHRGDLGHAHEVLTPILRDPPSMLPLAVGATEVLLNPTRAAALAHAAVRNYSITPAAIDQARSARP
jgi:hypothetical protein